MTKLMYLRQMRLERIKLAGFKSFVDPTTVIFPSNLCGIVGPNGCGKSNVIDAVRWVMGESSAKMLRGESMADVIFNGSSSRQPVGLASIELLFDNSDGSAGGEYAKYSQISVKRQVNRDGQSNYFLNGMRCRRRDIQDLFLGTGLGPRSYAIIEQGMISRLIEARPEDLRLFLEEAAGISKYKERRRETENRIQSTRENLDRLNDLREEVAKQLLHLERQAATAQKYKRLKEEERQFDAELKALRWRAFDVDLAQRDQVLSEKERDLEANMARQRHLEAETEVQRAEFIEASDHFNLIQGRFYAVGAEIARLEQGIQFSRENRRRLELELHRLQDRITEGERIRERDEVALRDLDEQIRHGVPDLVQAEEGRERAIKALEMAEASLMRWEAQSEELNRQAAQPSQQAQLEQARINHLEQKLAQDKSRLSRLEEELGNLTIDELGERIGALESREIEINAAVTGLASETDRLARAIDEQDRAERLLIERLDQSRTFLQSARGRQSSLMALQESALAASDEKTAVWLVAEGLADAPRLVDALKVEPGWELAVESVLGLHLKAVCTPHIDHHQAGLASASGSLALLDIHTPAEVPALAGSLFDYVDCPWPLQGLLGGARPVASISQALADRAGLAPGQALVTREGIRVGVNWVSTPERDNPVTGVITRAAALKELETEIGVLEDQVRAMAVTLDESRCQRQSLEARREGLQNRFAEAQRTLARVHAELGGLRARLEHRQERRQALAAEMHELNLSLQSSLEEMGKAREQLHTALDAVRIYAERREALSGQRDGLRAAVGEVRACERDWRERESRLRVSIESGRARREAVSGGLDRIRIQHDQLVGQASEVRQGLADLAEPLAEQEDCLDQHLGQRLEVERALGQARDQLGALDRHVRDLEHQRQEVEKIIRKIRDDLDKLRLQQQDLVVLRRTLEEQLKELTLSPVLILANLSDPAAEVEEWQQRLTQVSQRIARLGNINLAAIDEYQIQAERKIYLDAQYEDIHRSLETLEQVIRRIDRETRGRFKDTYDRVNQGFQQLFPRLFGGGHAYLELTGQDLLETGVSVMARPPGKRNSSIHLLSGGEKALTAVALVFAIFQLNPAPFCMLDEVDAPLDDANVGRFCELVRSMSDRVQFIFVSHNKVTMEIADHLMGVTMHEAGVSRLVSVDIEEAARLAATA